MSIKDTTSMPKLFIGIDIHKKTWKVHSYTDIGEGATQCYEDSIHFESYTTPRANRKVAC